MADAGGGDWGCLPDGGKDGLFLIVVSLGWWIGGQHPSMESKVWDAIEDVTWVIGRLISCLAADDLSSPVIPPTSPFFQYDEGMRGVSPVGSNID